MRHAQAMKSEGLEVAVYYPDLSFPNLWSSNFSLNPRLKFEIEDGLPTFRLKGAFFPKFSFLSARMWQKAASSAYPAIEKTWGKPDLIHARSSLGGMVADEIFRKWGIPYVVSEHHTDVEMGLTGWKAKMAKDYFGNAAGLAAVSNGVGIQMTRLVGRQVQTLPNYVDTQFFTPRVVSPNPVFTFLTIGEGSYLKGHDIAMEALEMLLKRGVNAQLRIGGRMDSLGLKLQESARKKGMDDSMIFLGLLSHEQVREEMNRADCYLHCSRLEPFGKVLNEAMAMGLPLLSTACAGPKDIVTNEVGLLVPVNDSAEMAASMQQMMGEVNKYNKEDIRKAAVERYGKAVLVRKWIGFYKQSMIDR